ncbi:MAG: ferritin-like domain-containing protein [Taibaiella sp.]|nr:ferritin-like domain-containing protein [Taibaiella sp.]
MKQSFEQTQDELAVKNFSRRNFFQMAGGLAGAGMLFAACSKSSDTTGPTSFTLTNNDTGILNYAYALEQLEAAFYIQVIATPYSGMSGGEKTLLTAVRDHEVAHREFFKAALSSSAIGSLTVDFSIIDFTSRTSVLSTAMAFEDLGVSAYNGAGPLFQSPTYLGLAGKIVSVEARHAAYLRDLVTPNSFATNADGYGLDFSKPPSVVLMTASKYLKTKVTSLLP